MTFATSKRPVLACRANHAANFDVHPEVNANLFHALLDTNEQRHISADLITQSQAPDGSWHSFFYPSKFYSTCHFMELIQRLGGFQPQSEKCLRFLTETQNTDGSWGDIGNPYETALTVRAFASHAPGAGEVSRGLDFLVAAQNDDGSWHGDKVIWDSHEVWLPCVLAGQLTFDHPGYLWLVAVHLLLFSEGIMEVATLMTRFARQLSRKVWSSS